MNQAELLRRFTYHAPDAATRDLHNDWRDLFLGFADELNDLPGGDTREKATAFTKLEELEMWVHAHIARNLHGSRNEERR